MGSISLGLFTPKDICGVGTLVLLCVGRSYRPFTSSLRCFTVIVVMDNGDLGDTSHFVYEAVSHLLNVFIKA